MLHVIDSRETNDGPQGQGQRAGGAIQRLTAFAPLLRAQPGPSPKPPNSGLSVGARHTHPLPSPHLRRDLKVASTPERLSQPSQQFLSSSARAHEDRAEGELKRRCGRHLVLEGLCRHCGLLGMAGDHGRGRRPGL